MKSKKISKSVQQEESVVERQPMVSMSNSERLEQLSSGEASINTSPNQLRDAITIGESGGEETSGLSDAWTIGGGIDAADQPDLLLSKTLFPTSYFHAMVDLDDAVNTPDNEVGSQSDFKEELWARPRRTKDNPYSRKNKTPKSERKLVKTTNRDKTSDPEWLQVKQRQGSLEQPNVKNRMIEEDIFLGKKPQTNDIIQGVIKDCYFLAAVTSIVNKDPVRLRQMMTSNGETLTVNFHRLDRTKEPGQQWVPAPVTVDHSLLHSQYKFESTPVSEVAKFRVADEPKYTEWYAEVEDGTLSITKEAAYEAALWLPLLEKAYAKFQDQWGAYGEGKGEYLDPGKLGVMKQQNDFSEEDLDIGYELLHWGTSTKVYPMFFGETVSESGFHSADNENADTVDSNLLETLLQLEGVGMEEGQELYLDAIANFHYYSVLGSDLRDHQNQPVELTLEDVRLDGTSLVSAQLSTVTIRNPYGQDSNDSFGTREEEHNGVSTLSIYEFQKEFMSYGFSLVG